MVLILALAAIGQRRSRRAGVCSLGLLELSRTVAVGGSCAGHTGLIILPALTLSSQNRVLTANAARLLMLQTDLPTLLPLTRFLGAMLQVAVATRGTTNLPLLLPIVCCGDTGRQELEAAELEKCSNPLIQ